MPLAHQMASDDGEAQVAAVVAAPGVAQMATWLMEKELSGEELLLILSELVVNELPLTLIWPRKKQLTPKVDALLSVLNQLRMH
ncbi:LysR substrate-binding domain-containing protein [Erwinia sp. P7711]|uniref:LysR substrate-binding domain-containing protein n=1 Tax=Erwinia sp. P7711 TaxID=3141451 RepID=UPI00319608C4